MVYCKPISGPAPGAGVRYSRMLSGGSAPGMGRGAHRRSGPLTRAAVCTKVLEEGPAEADAAVGSVLGAVRRG